MSEIRNAEGALCAVVNIPSKEKVIEIPMKVFLLKEIEEELTYETTAERDERILSYLYDREMESTAKDRAERKFKKIMKALHRDCDEVTIGKNNKKSANEFLKLVHPGRKTWKNSGLPVTSPKKHVYDTSLL